MPSVEIRGNTDFRKALKRFAPDLDKAMKKELARGLKPVVKAARGYVSADSPMSGWAGRSFSEAKFPFYNASIIRKGIVYSTSVSKPNKYGWTSNARISNNSGIGKIYETAGSKGPDGQKWVGRDGSSGHNVSHSTNRTAGATFISMLGDLTRSQTGTGRLIYRAWAENNGVGLGIALKAIAEARREFYNRSKTQTFSKAA